MSTFIDTNFTATMFDNFNTANALNFIASVNQSNMYIGVGREESWSANEEDSGFVPPPPVDSIDYKNEVWNNLLGITKIDQINVKLMRPRKDWGDPALGADAYRFRIGDIVTVNTLTGVNNHPQHPTGIPVYRCVAEPESGVCSISGVTDKESCESADGTWDPTPSPAGVDNIPRGGGSGFATGDGYVWDYLYTINQTEASQYLTNEWIVVPTQAELAADAEAWGLQNQIISGNEWKIAEQAAARWVGIFGYIRANQFAESAAVSYRQVCLINNPLVFVPNAMPQPASNEFYKASDLAEDSGNILFVENRQPIFQSIEQVEEIKIYFEF